MIIYFIISQPKYVEATEKNRLNETTVLLSNQNLWLRK